jgi:hypothetical protein
VAQKNGTPPERTRLPRADDERIGPARQAARADGIRHLRRLSNWTLATMLVGVGASSAALAHAIPGLSGGATAVVQTAGAASAATGGSAKAPTVSGAVATSGGSGVAAAPGASSGSRAVGSGRVITTSEGS